MCKVIFRTDTCEAHLKTVGSFLLMRAAKSLSCYNEYSLMFDSRIPEYTYKLRTFMRIQFKTFVYSNITVATRILRDSKARTECNFEVGEN